MFHLRIVVGLVLWMESLELPKGFARSESWFWQDGTPFSFENWQPGEPNNFHGHLVRMVSDLGVVSRSLKAVRAEVMRAEA